MACAGLAAVPDLMHYQGVLTDSYGMLMGGTHDLVFRIYAEETGGTHLWEETHDDVIVDRGLFNVILSNIPPDLFEDAERYMEMTVDTEVITPRTRIASVAYAQESPGTGSSGDGHSLDAADGDPVDVVYVSNAGNVGIGTTTPSENLVVGEDSDYVAGGARIVVAETSPTGAPGITFWEGSGFYSYMFWMNEENKIRLGSRVDGTAYHALHVDRDRIGIGTSDPTARLDVEAGNFQVTIGVHDDIAAHHAAVRGLHTNCFGYLGAKSVAGSNYYGVYGAAITGGAGTNVGVYGKATGGTTNHAGFFEGDVFVEAGELIVDDEDIIIADGDLHVDDGWVYTTALRITGGTDLAEPFEISDGKSLPAGALVVIDEESPGQLKMSDKPYDRRVAGVISGAGGVNPGITLTQEGVFQDGQNVALSGRVYALADVSNGPITPGDLLTTSGRTGHAMKVTDRDRSQGAIIGKAMTSLTEGQGLVLVLVSLQ